MRTRCLASLLCVSLLLLSACGGGGGGGSGGLGNLIGVAPQNLVAIVADLEDDGEDLFQLIIGDVEGGGHAVVTAFADPLTSGVNREGVLWSPDHTRLAYFARPDGGDLAHLFVLAPPLGLPIDILGVAIEAAQLDFSFSTLAWSPDGTRLSFTATDGGGTSRIFLVNPNGSAFVDLLALSPIGGLNMNGRAQWAPDSSRVAVHLVLGGGAGERLVTFRADGSGFADVTASPVPVADADVREFRWNPQSTHLLIRGELEEANFVDAYVAPADGSADYLRVSPHTGGGDLTAADWSPDGSRIAYLSNLESGNATMELFTVAPDGTGNVKVSGSFVAGGTTAQLFWAPDGSRIAFRASRFVEDSFELFTVEPTGAGLQKVSPALAAGGNALPSVDVLGRSESPWAPDSSRLAFIAQVADVGTQDVFLVDADGSNLDPVTAAVSGCEVRVVRWSPDSTHLLIQAELTTDGVRNVFVSQALVGSPTLLQVTFATQVGSSAFAHDWSADGTRVVFEERASQAPGSPTLARSCPRGLLDVVDLSDPVEDLDTLRTR